MANYKIAMIVGSLRKESINRKIARSMCAIRGDNLDCQMVEIGDLPLYNQDYDLQRQQPEQYVRFREQIAAADGIEAQARSRHARHQTQQARAVENPRRGHRRVDIGNQDVRRVEAVRAIRVARDDAPVQTLQHLLADRQPDGPTVGHLRLALAVLGAGHHRRERLSRSGLRMGFGLGQAGLGPAEAPDGDLAPGVAVLQAGFGPVGGDLYGGV